MGLEVEVLEDLLRFRSHEEFVNFYFFLFLEMMDLFAKKFIKLIRLHYGENLPKVLSRWGLFKAIVRKKAEKVRLQAQMFPQAYNVHIAKAS